jgi:hypothetical protein
MDLAESWSVVNCSTGAPSMKRNVHLEAVAGVCFGALCFFFSSCDQFMHAGSSMGEREADHLNAQWCDSEGLSAVFGLKNKISVLVTHRLLDSLGFFFFFFFGEQEWVAQTDPCPWFFLRGSRVMNEMTMSVLGGMVVVAAAAAGVVVVVVVVVSSESVLGW